VSVYDYSTNALANTVVGLGFREGILSTEFTASMRQRQADLRRMQLDQDGVNPLVESLYAGGPGVEYALIKNDRLKLTREGFIINAELDGFSAPNNMPPYVWIDGELFLVVYPNGGPVPAGQIAAGGIYRFVRRGDTLQILSDPVGYVEPTIRTLTTTDDVDVEVTDLGQMIAFEDGGTLNTLRVVVSSTTFDRWPVGTPVSFVTDFAESVDISVPPGVAVEGAFAPGQLYGGFVVGSPARAFQLIRTTGNALQFIDIG